MGDPIFTIGPHWQLFSITFILMTIGWIILVGKVNEVTKDDRMVLLVTMMIGLFTLICYLAAALKNPGLAGPRDLEKY